MRFTAKNLSRGLTFIASVLVLSGFQPLFSQVQERFTDGEFKTNPPWTGDTSKFVVNAGLQLQLNGKQASDTAYLSTPSVLVENTEWSFFVKMAFSPSNTNYVRIYLASDRPNLKSSLNGYYVRIGETGSLDGVDLYRQSGNTSSKIIDGIAGHAAKSNTPLHVRVTRDAAGNWNLYCDTLGGNNFIHEGAAYDNTYGTSVSAGVYCRYSSSNRTKFYFDNIVIKPFAEDTVGPLLDSVKATGKNALCLYFSEALKKITAENTINYVVLNGPGNPLTARLDSVNPSVVYLKFSASFPDDKQNTLIINGLADTSSNYQDSLIRAYFTYSYPVVPAYGDIVINEIYADPSPAVGLPGAEFIEILNLKSKPINLKGWKLTDGSSTAVFKNYIVAPGAFVILCPASDTSSYKSFGQVLGLSGFPSLNNSGDRISLFNDSLRLIDEVNYTDSWYKDPVKKAGGWTLEKINPGKKTCLPDANWKASVNLLGGTPGKANSIYSTLADTSSPRVSRIKTNDSRQITVFFTKPYDSISASSTAIYLISGLGFPVSAVTASHRLSVTLQFSKNIEPGRTYLLTVNGLKDCEGNASKSTFTFSSGITPQKGNLVVTELMADPSPVAGLPEAEYVEIYNRSPGIVELGGCLICDESSCVTLDSALISPGEYVILTPSANREKLRSYGRVIDMASMPSLNNSADKVRILNPSKQTIDEVRYRDTWYRDLSKKEGGYSLERIDPGFLCESSENWVASADPRGGTPGAKNSVLGTYIDNTPPDLLKAEALSDSTVLLSFSEAPDSLLCTTPGLYSINGAYPLSAVPSPEGVILKLVTAIKPMLLYTVEVDRNGFRDCAGNVIRNNTARFGLGEKPGPGDVVINEVLFNPLPYGKDFVELYNRSALIIDCRDLYLYNESFSPEQAGFRASGSSLLLLPGEYIVLTDDPGSITGAFHCPYPSRITASSLPSFQDKKGSVILCDKEKRVIDRLDYSESLHYPLLSSREGVSLERINPGRRSADSTNWHSASGAYGYATPGYRNSQYSEDVEAGDEITFGKDIFSPDNDGYEDNLSIHYKFGLPGLLANVRIYNEQGLLVRRLLNNELLGASGTVSWDGLSDSNEKASIGIYVIHFQTIDTKGRVSNVKKACVLAEKL